MRYLADENVHRKVVSCLRDSGLDVDWVRQVLPGATDEQILLLPDIAETILITCDRDFGELILKQRLPAPASIIYSRIEHRDWAQTASRIFELVQAGVAKNAITTITRERTRVRYYSDGVSND